MQLVNILFLLIFLFAKVIPSIYLGYHINDYRKYLSTEVIKPFDVKFEELLEFFSGKDNNSLTERRDKESIRRIVVSSMNFDKKVNRLYVPLSIILIILNIYPF